MTSRQQSNSGHIGGCRALSPLLPPRVVLYSIRTHCNSHENRPEKAGKKRPQFSPLLKLLMTIEPIPPTAFTLPQNIGGPQKAGVPYSRSEIQCIVLNKTKCLQYISKRRLNDEKKSFKLQF